MNNEYLQKTADLLIPATIDTLYIVGFTTLFSTIIGFLLGIILYLTQKNGLLKNQEFLHNLLSTIINIGRSVPFVIIIIALFPLSRVIVGTSLGRDAVIVPLTIAAIPFVARLVEASFNEINKGVIEVAITSGASITQIVFKVLIPETLHMQILNITTSAISIVGYSAMAGLVNGGGLGDIAIRYGHQRDQNDILYISIVLLILIVYIIQITGTFLSNKFNKL